MAATDEFRWQLDVARRLAPGDPLTFGSALEAHRSVVTALACFAFSADSFVDAVSRAISLGGDTDTVAAMAGGLIGARHGTAPLPPAALAKLEDGPRGKGYIEQLAIGLSTRA